MHDGRRYLYLVNREHYPISVCVEFAGEHTRLRDAAIGQEETVERDWRLVLDAYELRAVTLPTECAVTGFSYTVPAEILDQARMESE